MSPRLRHQISPPNAMDVLDPRLNPATGHFQRLTRSKSINNLLGVCASSNSFPSTCITSPVSGFVQRSSLLIASRRMRHCKVIFVRKHHLAEIGLMRYRPPHSRHVAYYSQANVECEQLQFLNFLLHFNYLLR